VIRLYCALLALWLLLPVSYSTAEDLAKAGPLATYVKKADDAFTWKKRREGKIGGCEYVEMLITSQSWKGTTWKHQAFLLKPSSANEKTKHALLMITGGNWRDEIETSPPGNLPREATVLASVAENFGTPIMILQQVPFQPIFDGMREDAAIAHTFEQYVRTGDDEWPLLFPMVKSAVKAMDVTQSHCKEAWNMDIETFTLTGASKRGWTTWLTSAVDKRVTALCPMVIDMLKMGPQMKHQEDTWGEPSEEIADYTSRGLNKLLDTPRGAALVKMVDPLVYKTALQQPKVVMLGTNDAYWPLDACNLYWDDLEGPKWVCYIPNNPHGLNDIGRIVGALGAVHMQAATGKQMPKYAWKYEDAAKGLKLTVTPTDAPKKVRIWKTTAETKDFRKSKWVSEELAGDAANWSYLHEAPDAGYAAFFAELEYDYLGFPTYLSTTLRILPPQEGK
jgi:PhoPQ-activated pathogenicity-related protein